MLSDYAKQQMTNRGYTPQDIAALDAGQTVSTAQQNPQNSPALPTQPYNPFAPVGQQPVQQPQASPKQVTSAAPVTPPITPAPPSPAPSTGQGMDPVGFTMLAKQLEQGLTQNNSLVQSKNLLIKHLYDQPLTQQELQSLSPELQQVVSQGSKLDQEMYIRLLNDQVQGRFQSLDMSMNFLTQGYTAQQQYLNDKKQKDMTNVLNYVHAYGSSALDVLTKLYGPQGIQALKNEGIDVEGLSGVPTLTQQRIQENQANVNKIKSIASQYPKEVKGAPAPGGLINPVNWMNPTLTYEVMDPITGQKTSYNDQQSAIDAQNALNNQAMNNVTTNQMIQSQSDWAIQQ